VTTSSMEAVHDMKVKHIRVLLSYLSSRFSCLLRANVLKECRNCT
jgi:hypothetical protein